MKPQIGTTYCTPLPRWGNPPQKNDLSEKLIYHEKETHLFGY